MQQGQYWPKDGHALTRAIPGPRAGRISQTGIKKTKSRLLNEARKRTRLNRKVLIGKLAHPATIREKKKRGPRQRAYTTEVQVALIQVWELFDYPCGQRLAPALRKETGRLRRAQELECSDEVAGKLEAISPRSIDRLLDREKRVRGLRQNRNPVCMRCCTRRCQ